MQLCIYTAVYLTFLLVMDFIFNGVIVEYLEDRLPERLFYLLYTNKVAAACIVYAVGLLVISIAHIVRLVKLLQLASTAFDEENSGLWEDGCPNELLDFSAKLKVFQQNLQVHELARQNAEQQKKDLIVYLAHDLKTPLTSVIGYLSLLEETPDIPVEQRTKYIGIALDKAYRLEQLINEFFDITRFNLHAALAQKSVVNLTVLLIQIIEEFYPMLEEKQMTVVQTIAADMKLSADSEQLARVFDNLFRNAVSYGYSHTAILVDAKTEGDTAVVKICSKGDEIPSDRLQHIFEKFIRLDSARQSRTGGAGLGLAIAKQIVELHNGTITVSSRGNDTTFTVTLPL